MSSIVEFAMALRRPLTVAFCFVALTLASFMIHAASTPPVENKQPEPGQKQIEYSAAKITNARRARALKSTADFNFDQNDPELAATFYLRALALAPDAFSVAEKKQIATRLVAANRKREAIEVLRQLAIENGTDVDIRVSLAKLLSATEDYTAAIAEVDKILNQDRGNKYALLVKANSLRTQQKFGESAGLYRRILEESDDFDARIGLTYSLLAMGEKTKARESFGRLRSEDDDQAQQIDELSYYIDSVTRPTVDLYSSTFTDSDKNRTVERRVTLRGTGTDWDLTAAYGEKDARSLDPDTGESYLNYTARYVTGSASANFSEVLRLTIKLGQTTLGSDKLSTVGTGDIAADFKLGLNPLSVFSVNVSHDVLATSGAQFDKKIEQDVSSAKLTRALNAKTTLYLIYRYRQYSDANSANDFQGSADYTLYRGGPIIRAGYLYRHMDYNHPAFNGYFDPQDYSSNQVFTTLYYEYARLYFDFELDYGKQSYQRNFNEFNEPFRYASATIGTTGSRKLRLELHGEYNASGSGGANASYDDLLLSGQLSYMF